MGDKSKIEWTATRDQDGNVVSDGATWNPIRGCTRVSEGCGSARGGGCYAERIAARFSGPGMPFEGFAVNTPAGPRWTGKVALIPEKLGDPLRWRKPRFVFANSMSDLFHEGLTNEEIAAVFGVMAACPQHHFQVLTKRPERMLEWFRQPCIAEKVDMFRHVAMAGRIEEYFTPERIESVAGWPGYWITSKGRVLSDHKGERRELKPMPGEQGHARVMLYRGEGETSRPLIHHLVLSAFDGPRRDDAQGCHITGDATNNALWNLRWGSQSENWIDRKRHGNRRSYSKLCKEQVASLRQLASEGMNAAELGRRFGISDTQARNIITEKQWAPEYGFEWPLPSVWLGVSCEDQATADERIPLLLRCPAAVRWVSAEPLLGPIDLARYLPRVELIYAGKEVRYRVPVNDDIVTRQLPKMRAQNPDNLYTTRPEREGDSMMHPAPFLDWVVAGGESGPGARPCHPHWARSIRDQCVAAEVKFFWKQWGSWAPNCLCGGPKGCPETPRPKPGKMGVMFHCGKGKAGRELDDRTWDEMPAVKA